jgi:carbonic anhydrase/acetyltransferase-like protein (isoleucine patch superfamily)
MATFLSFFNNLLYDEISFICLNVTIGYKVMLHACLIGMSATIMDDVVVGKQSIVVAGALVTLGKIIETQFLWAGVPAKFVRKLTEEELNWLKKSAENYVKYRNSYLEVQP